MRLAPLFPTLFAVAGCSPADTAEAPAGEEADADADADADPTWPASTLTGTVTVESTYDGVVVCSVDATLTGTPYTGACEGCDFAVNIASEITRDDSGADCANPYSTASFVARPPYTDLVMFHADSYLFLGSYYVEDAFGALYAYEGHDGTQADLLAYTYYGSPYGSGSFELGADAVRWEVSDAGIDSFWYDYAYCDTAANSYATSGYGGEAHAEDVKCDGTTADVWTFVATGNIALVTVDTVSAATTFDPRFWVNGPDDCATRFADDNFTCAYPPPAYACPSAEVDGLTAGATYEVVVSSHDSGACVGEEAGYRLLIEGGTDVTLATDDGVSGYAYSLSIVGTGTIASEE